jgi:hypothetical protein
VSANTATFDAMFAIAQDNGGQLTPAAVVEASRPDDAYFHDRFEWDDAKAAQRDREATAARLIRQIHITRLTDTERGPVRIRAFLPTSGVEEIDPSTDTEPWTYVSIDNLSANAVQAILRQMEKDVASLRRKYRDHRAALDQMLRESLDGVA